MQQQEISDMRLVQWTLFGDNCLRHFRDQEIQIVIELCFYLFDATNKI
jgi:hypothetical protein